MANSITTYTDNQIMKCLLMHNFTDLGRTFIDDVVTSVKAGAFYEAQNLDEVRLPSLVDIGPRAFESTDIATLDIPWANLESIGQLAFYQAWANVPSNLSLPKLTAMGNGVFAGVNAAKNTKLVSVSMPLWTGSTPPEVLGSNATIGIFEYCNALTSISAPLLQTLPVSFLRYCTALTEVNFPRVASISSNALQGCSALRKIDLGGAITSMQNAFMSSTNSLEALILRGVTTVPTLMASTFTGTRIASGYAYVYVPARLLATFQVASVWSTYSAQLRAIEDYPDVCGS